MHENASAVFTRNFTVGEPTTNDVSSPSSLNQRVFVELFKSFPRLYLTDTREAPGLTFYYRLSVLNTSVFTFLRISRSNNVFTIG